jgi:PTH1 family peptidyl-tRNA hydrolase
MKLIVGLGNPGGEYSKTRHNVGFRVLDLIAAKLGETFATGKFKCDSTIARFAGVADDGKLLLVKPQTFMNLSGESVIGNLGYYKVDRSGLLVVIDDVTLPVGTLRMRKDGSAGGHNGLKDIERVLGSKDYARLKVGVGGRVQGQENAPRDLAGHVLSRFSAEEEAALKDPLQKAVEACLVWAESGVDAAVKKLN